MYLFCLENPSPQSFEADPFSCLPLTLETSETRHSHLNPVSMSSGLLVDAFIVSPPYWGRSSSREGVALLITMIPDYRKWHSHKRKNKWTHRWTMMRSTQPGRSCIFTQWHQGNLIPSSTALENWEIIKNTTGYYSPDNLDLGECCEEQGFPWSNFL